MSARFEKYDRPEVEAVLHSFLMDLVPIYRSVPNTLETAVWTELVLDRFAESCPEHAVVDASPAKKGKRSLDRPPELSALAVQRDTYGECLFDLSHWRLPRYDVGSYGTQAWWRSALAKPAQPRLLLALECEMGNANSAPATLRKVMDDAAKLLGAASLVKVMVVATNSATNLADVRELLNALCIADPLSTVADEASRPTWAFVDLPWDARDPTWGILG